MAAKKIVVPVAVAAAQLRERVLARDGHRHRQVARHQRATAPCSAGAAPGSSPASRVADRSVTPSPCTSLTMPPANATLPSATAATRST